MNDDVLESGVPSVGTFGQQEGSVHAFRVHGHRGEEDTRKWEAVDMRGVEHTSGAPSSSSHHVVLRTGDQSPSHHPDWLRP
jgi:hypothetical protein